MTLPSHGIARSAATKQSSEASDALDCFATLATTEGRP